MLRHCLWGKMVCGRRPRQHRIRNPFCLVSLRLSGSPVLWPPSQVKIKSFGGGSVTVPIPVRAQNKNAPTKCT